VEEVIETVLKDKPFYESSGGGMTLSGGEPLLQPDITRSLFKLAHEAGIHTALDTTGFAKWETIESVLPYVDLVLFDIKSLDDRKHQKWTGVSNRLILENVKKIADAGTKIRIRSVIIHDVNYWDPTYAKSIAEFARSLGDSVVGVDLMPYHNFADKKYEKLGRDHFFKGFPNINKEDLEDYLAEMDQDGRLKPSIGGLIGTEKKENEE
jgi:pyruvate formate lyase activating enzyme